LETEIHGYWSPLIQLVDDGHPSNLQPKDLGRCYCDGHSLDFYAPVVDAMPTVHVGELIAHELAHVALITVGEFACTDRTQPRMFDDIEIMADEVMELWDFDPDGIDHWMEKNWTWPK
jgi:hypothetical protein